MAEVIDIGLDNLEPISINIGNTNQSSVNFGSGIELLMNDKKRSNSNSVAVDLGELDNLEKELNDLSNQSNSNTSSAGSKLMTGLSGFTNMFGFGDTKPAAAESAAEYSSESNLGQATKESIGQTKTWDGFSKYNDIPNDPPASSYTSSSKMNDREKGRKKRMMIKKLEEWYEKGSIKNISHFSNESAYEEVEDEYENALEDKRKKDSIKLQGWWFMTFVNSVEYANAAFDPFGINLEGWGEQINEDIDSYEEIFTELHEKYKGGKLAPELSLLLRLGFSAAVVNFTNKALSTATPGFNDVIRQSPELMKMFTNATVSSMSQQSPGFAFASNMMNQPDKINNSFGPPPPPVETKNQPQQQRPSMQFTQAPGNRQDINAARGTMFREQGVDINNQFNDPNRQERTIRTPAQQPAQSYQPQNQYQQQPPQQQMSMRPEMRGPQNTDIDNILSGLKTRTINIHESANNSSQQNVFLEDDSMISITSLKDMQNTSMPKKSNRRRNKSDKNTITLDI